jgi:hypothetical protein
MFVAGLLNGAWLALFGSWTWRLAPRANNFDKQDRTPCIKVKEPILALKPKIDYKNQNFLFTHNNKSLPQIIKL